MYCHFLRYVTEAVTFYENGRARCPQHLQEVPLRVYTLYGCFPTRWASKHVGVATYVARFQVHPCSSLHPPNNEVIRASLAC